MIVVVFILLLIFVSTLVVAIQAQINTSHNQEILNHLTKLCVYKHFSVSEYYDRIEKTSLNIAAEYEKLKDYKITLWLGLDGLQLNPDGSSSWIKRAPAKPIIAFQPTFPIDKDFIHFEHQDCTPVRFIKTPEGKVIAQRPIPPDCFK